jgi:23S rRNA (uracil1939-C5)-methyltransferase
MNEAGGPVTVRGIAAGGDGVATLPDGRTVFIPRAAPGDQLRLRDVRLHARFARADIGEVLEPGSGRVMPPCPHYVADRCGGCQVMHLSAATQRSVKARIAGDALRRIGGFDVADPDVTPSPVEFGYRTKVTYTMQRGRMGFHPLNEPARVFDVHECLIADPELRRLHAALHDARSVLPQDGARIVLRIDRAQARHVIVRTVEGDAWTGGKALQRALTAAGIATVIWWHPERGKPRVVAGSDTPSPATVFEQVHPAMGILVRQVAIASAAVVSGTHAWDLYAGVGDTTLALAQRGATVDSVEVDPRAVAVAEKAGPSGPRRHVGLVEEVVRTLPAPEVVLTNPPRTGMAPTVAATLAGSGARRIVYISCDAATLARDLRRMSESYTLSSVRVFDQFPQTAHLECVAVMDRA